MFMTPGQSGSHDSTRRIEPNKPVQTGLGDWVASKLEKIGIKKKPGCGCQGRQDKLNKWFPFKS